MILGASVGWLGISMISDGLPALLLPYRLAVGGAPDATTLGGLTLFAILVAALLQPIAGWWSDRIGRTPVIATGVVVAGAGLALLSLSDELIYVFAGALLALCGVSVVQAGQQALLPDNVDSAKHGVGSGMKGAFDVGGALLGFLVLAAFLGSGQPGMAAVILLAVLAGGVAVGLLLLGRPRVVAAPHPWSEDLMRAPRTDDRALYRLIVQRLVFLLGIYVVGRFLFSFVGARFGLTPDEAAAQAGVVLLVLTAATVAASIPAGWLADRLGRTHLMQAGGVLAGMGIALLLVAPSIAALTVVGVLLALGSAAFSAGSWALLTDLAAGPESGRKMGIAQLGTAGAAAGAGAFGLLIDATDGIAPGAGFAVAFLLAAACALAGGFMWRQHTQPRPQALTVTR
jgi:MFS family permease